MATIDKFNDGTYSNLSREKFFRDFRQRAKLEKNLGSIADFDSSAVCIVRYRRIERKISQFAKLNRLGIPVFAIVDTNSDPSNVDFVIPANDDATKSVSYLDALRCYGRRFGRRKSYRYGSCW